MFQWSNLVIVAITNKCNMNCRYCFQGDKSNLYGDFMTIDTFKCIIDRIADDFSLYGNLLKGKKPIQILLHGGEPTLLPLKDLDAFLEYANKTLTERKVPYELLIQTNGIKLNKDYREVLKRQNVQVGVSLDGITNDLRDTPVDKEVILNNVLEGIKENMSIGTLSVVTKYNIHTLPDELRKLPLMRVTKLCLVQDASPDMDLEASNEDIFNLIYKPAIDSFIEKGRFEYHSDVTNYMQKFLLDRLTNYRDFNKNTCHYKECGACLQLISFFPNGNLRICDRVNYKEKAFMVEGPSIFTKSFLDLDQIKMNLSLNSFMKPAQVERGCDNCLYKQFCIKPCPSAHYHKYGRPFIPEKHCKLVKSLYEYFDKNLLNILKAYKKSQFYQGKITFTEQRILSLKTAKAPSRITLPYKLNLDRENNCIILEELL